MKNINEVAAAMAVEMISQALTDLKKKEMRKEVLSWFNRRDLTPFGYGWCLQCSGANPNMVRAKINGVI